MTASPNLSKWTAEREVGMPIIFQLSSWSGSHSLNSSCANCLSPIKAGYDTLSV